MFSSRFDCFQYRKYFLVLAGAATLLTLNSGARAASGELSDVERLGQALFEDANLSSPPGESCASCHEAGKAFTGNAHSHVPAIAAGSRPGVVGTRNTPSLMYAAFTPPFAVTKETNADGEIEYTLTGGFFWDGRADSLADQAMGPLFNPLEMNEANAAEVGAKLRAASYAPLFRQVFGKDALDDDAGAVKLAASAIAAFESTERFSPFSSKFDKYLRHEAELTPQEARGFDLFKNPEKGNCIACHVGDLNSRKPDAWLFTDYTYDSLGSPRNVSIPANADTTHFDLGLCARQGLSQVLPPDIYVESLCGAFKVPTLRNVAVTGPYFHNGSIAELRDVVSFYVTRDTNAAAWYPRTANGTSSKFDDVPAQYHGNVNTSEAPYDRTAGQAPRLNDDEIDDLVAFLKTLTDENFAAQ